MVIEIEEKSKKITDIEYERDFGKHTYYLVKTPLITDRAIAEKTAKDHRWDHLGLIFGHAKIITRIHNSQEYFLIYRYLDTTKLLMAYYDIGDSKEPKK